MVSQVQMPYHQKYSRASDMLTGTLGSRVNKRVENQSFPKRKSTNMVDVPLIFHSSSIRISIGFPIFPKVFHRWFSIFSMIFQFFHRCSTNMVVFPLIFHRCSTSMLRNTPSDQQERAVSVYRGHRGPRVGWNQPPPGRGGYPHGFDWLWIFQKKP